ncbi:trichothecene 3-O-acetyltransferase [Fusarium austroafricanum]|uniref:Trichothecene 3-O-acetyltransferase n=1 Tax=Fusarium austroafricanum TaxID=2364996 RepID=A0A8H4KVN6_9HYPO|nr:trichothecene 3-O-acetyltransferase [Fusarium austroafricanum]
MGALNVTNTHDLDIELDVLGQTPMLTKIYTLISFCYPITDPSAHPAIIATLNRGLKRLSQNVPWVAGQIIEGDDGLYKIKAFEETPRLVVKDLRDDPSAPTMEGLRKAEFPMSMFDENVIAARKTLPMGANYSPDDPYPVLLFQLNFIEGGLIFTVSGQHGCMDMTGQDEIIRLLSKACRDEAFTQEELSIMNLERKTIVPFLENYEVGPELDHQLVKPPPTTESPPAPAKASWAFFSFSPQALSELKDKATQTLDAQTKFISTDDALTSFIWQSISRARLARLDDSTSTLICRAVDVRTQVDAPKKYPGMLQNMTYNVSTLSQVTHEPLGVVASHLRSELGRNQLRRRTQALITYQRNSKGATSATADANPSTDVMLSSWAKLGCWEYDFGFGLGKPESVRRPIFEPFESLMYLMPKRPDGEITAALSLRDEDMETLKGDEEWKKYGRFIG